MRQVDRRALFTSGAAAALLAATGISLAERPSPGGRLRLAVAPFAGPLSPVAMAASFDTLTEVAAEGILKGELARGWQASTDARSWTLSLRQDVLFHDGTPLTASDAAASLAASDLRAVRIEARDRFTLHIGLAEADPDLPYKLAHPRLIISRAQDAGELPSRRVGTGLYRPVQLREGRHYLGQRRSPHYKDGSAGWIDELEIVTIRDAAVRAEALRDGYVDVAELPLSEGLGGRDDVRWHPASGTELASRIGVGVPKVLGTTWPMDDGRIAERWWLG